MTTGRWFLARLHRPVRPGPDAAGLCRHRPGLLALCSRRHGCVAADGVLEARAGRGTADGARDRHWGSRSASVPPPTIPARARPGERRRLGSVTGPSGRPPAVGSSPTTSASCAACPSAACCSPLAFMLSPVTAPISPSGPCAQQPPRPGARSIVPLHRPGHRPGTGRPRRGRPARPALPAAPVHDLVEGLHGRAWRSAAGGRSAG